MRLLPNYFGLLLPFVTFPASKQTPTVLHALLSREIVNVVFSRTSGVQFRSGFLDPSESRRPDCGTGLLAAERRKFRLLSLRPSPEWSYEDISSRYAEEWNDEDPSSECGDMGLCNKIMEWKWGWIEFAVDSDLHRFT